MNQQIARYQLAISYQLSAISDQRQRSASQRDSEPRAASCGPVVHFERCHSKQLLPRRTNSRACSPRASRMRLIALAPTDARCRSSFPEGRSRTPSFPFWPTQPSTGRWSTSSGVMSARSVPIMRIRISASPTNCCYRTWVTRARTECRPTILISTPLREPTSANWSVCSAIRHASMWSCSALDPMDMSAALFPGHPALEEASRLVVAVTDSPKPPPRRLTLTLPALAGAEIFIAAFGAEKRDAIREALNTPASPLPVARAARSGAPTIFLLDAHSSQGSVA